jgi:hypothetical protein
MKVINPSGSHVGKSRPRTAAETIIEILAMMTAKERLRKEIARKRQIAGDIVTIANPLGRKSRTTPQQRKSVRKSGNAD